MVCKAGSTLAVLLALGLPITGSAAPLFMHCRFTREVGFVAAGGRYFSIPVTEFLMIDPDARLFAEAEKNRGPWVNQCDQAGHDCRIDARTFSVTVAQPHLKLLTVFDREKRRYKSDWAQDNKQSFTYGTCQPARPPD